MRPFRILPVIDVQGGQVVRAVAGRRREYRPLVSVLTPSTDPLETARAFRRCLGLDELYLADLDAIEGGPPTLDLLRSLADDGFRLWVDAGVRGPRDVSVLRGAGVACVVAGLETVEGPDRLGEILRVHRHEVAFSLDLKGGKPLTTSPGWQGRAARDIGSEVLELGVERLIVLDLASVGMRQGAGTEELCRELRRQAPGVEILAGGGVRGPEDLAGLREAGLDGVLVATAFHEGRLRREHLRLSG